MPDDTHHDNHHDTHHEQAPPIEAPDDGPAEGVLNDEPAAANATGDDAADSVLDDSAAGTETALPGAVPDESAAPTATPAASEPPAAPRRRRAASRPAGPPAPLFSASPTPTATPTSTTATITGTTPAPATHPTQAAGAETTSVPTLPATSPPTVALFQPPQAVEPRRRARAATPRRDDSTASASDAAPDDAAASTGQRTSGRRRATTPDAAPATDERPADERPADGAVPTPSSSPDDAAPGGAATPATDGDAAAGEERGTSEGRGRRRRRGGRGRGRAATTDAEDGADDASSVVPAAEGDGDEPTDAPATEPVDGGAAVDSGSADGGSADGGSADAAGPAADDTTSSSSRRRRRRRRSGSADAGRGDDATADTPDSARADLADTSAVVVRTRSGRSGADGVTATKGSTRMEAKKQRRKENRDAGRRRPPILSEAEFLARRESVDRVMVVRQRGTQDAPVTQIAVLEDGMLVEHYVDAGSQRSLIGNVYLGKVQNVLPAMEAAFIDIGRGRNAVLYAGEVDWKSLGTSHRRIEQALEPGQPILVQVSKDPVGQKGARLSGHVSIPGRFVVYVPKGSMSGISRKLPDTERARLKTILSDIVPEDAEVIVRTAAEGASEEELRRDVARLAAQWADIEAKVAAGQAPTLLYAEPDLTLKIVRDLFNEDFASIVIDGDDVWDMISGYVSFVAPTLVDRLQRWAPADGEERDAFAAYRVDEQIAKGLERKVYLPSGGSLVIDRTEAMTVVDVNTGKFTGSGGNLEETVTRNNLEAAEEVVRQLRLRDIGGIIVIDFIDMVLEDNRELVLRRLVECLSRDRTKHQVAEVTSLGLVQMTRKRIGSGLLETFSEPCETCGGRGLHIRTEPVVRAVPDADSRAARHRRAAGRKSSRTSSSSKAAISSSTEATSSSRAATPPGQETVVPAAAEPIEAPPDAAVGVDAG
jgi:ribonuclease E